MTWFITLDAQVMLAVLVAACPAALALAAPATAIAGIAVAARHGILIRGSAFLEELADTTSLVIDKTGTLTGGRLQLHDILAVAGARQEQVLPLAAALGSASTHPVSRALAANADEQSAWPLSDVRERHGLGITARTALGEAVLGREELFASLGIAVPPPPGHDGPVVGLSLDGRFLAWMLLSDSLRPEAAAALEELRGLGLQRQLLLTGDRASVARAIGGQVGIQSIVAQALPHDKLECVIRETAAGHRPLVVGDGINDSLALKAGAVGVAMGGSGSDIALASADVVLASSDLRRLGTCIRLSRKCRRVLNANVVIGLAWMLAALLAAASGLLGSGGAIIAALLQNVSVLLVMANAGRLLRVHEPLS